MLDCLVGQVSGFVPVEGVLESSTATIASDTVEHVDSSSDRIESDTSLIITLSVSSLSVGLNVSTWNT